MVRTLKERKMNWIGHTHTLHGNLLLRTVLFKDELNGRNMQEIQERCWLDKGNSGGYREIKEKARYREEGRRLISGPD